MANLPKMRTVKEVQADIALSQSKLDNALRAYNQARKAVVAADDEMIEHRESVRKFKEELETIAFKEVTVVEESVRDKDISEFKERCPGVLAKLEAAGTAVITEPIAAWVRANRELATTHADCYVALAFYKGVLLSHKDKDTFSIRLANMEPSMRQIAHVFFMNDYLKSVLVDPSVKPKIFAWIEQNRKMLQPLHSFREVATAVARGLFGNKNPNNQELELIEDAMGVKPTVA